jgi:hypothetical protein
MRHDTTTQTVNKKVPLITATPPHVAPLFMDLRVPGVATIHTQQQASTWPLIPWKSLVSWQGWTQRPGGLEYGPAIHTSGPAPYARWAWNELPNKRKDDWWLLAAASHNSLMLHSTFASTEHVSLAESKRVMSGFRRALKSVTGVRL